MNAAGTGRNAYPTFGFVSAFAGIAVVSLAIGDFRPFGGDGFAVGEVDFDTEGAAGFDACDAGHLFVGFEYGEPGNRFVAGTADQAGGGVGHTDSVLIIYAGDRGVDFVGVAAELPEGEFNR